MAYKLKVDRAKWSTGKLKRVVGEGENVLRHKDGKCCIMGHYAKQVLGMKNSELTDRSTLMGERNDFVLNHPEAFGLTTRLEGNITDINDDTMLKQRTREGMLQKCFVELNTKLSFFGKLAR